MLSRKKIAVLTLAAVAGATIILTQTASSNGQAYKLEGAWTISSEGLLANFTAAPSDPSGREGTSKINWVTLGPMLGLLTAAYGADAWTDSSVVAKMISRDTAQFTGVTYWIKTGTPNEIKMIMIDAGTIQRTGPDNGLSQSTWAGYLPSRDVNGDGLPDDLENPPDLGPFPGSAVFTRIPMLP
jgi:hypothetical protein